MPELPEVETVCRLLRRHLPGRVVRAVEVREPRLRERVAADLASRVAGRRIADVRRRAKYLLLALDDGQVWVFHLGMSGRLIRAPVGTARAAHDHVVARLDDGYELRFHDPRRFGLCAVVAGAALAGSPRFRRLGPEPFERRFDADYLYALTRRSGRTIKDLLMDQTVVAGLGNIYVNEALFRAGVRPSRRAARLPRAAVAALATAIPRLLLEAVRWCGTTFSDYRDAYGERGRFEERLAVYGRTGEPCRRCGATVRGGRRGQRSSFWCPRCQR